MTQEGFPKENIIYISFESSRYRHIENDIQLDEIILEKTSNLKEKIYLLFDEIQQVVDWEKSINSYRVDFDSDIHDFKYWPNIFRHIHFKIRPIRKNIFKFQNLLKTP